MSDIEWAAIEKEQLRELKHQQAEREQRQRELEAERQKPAPMTLKQMQKKPNPIGLQAKEIAQQRAQKKSQQQEKQTPQQENPTSQEQPPAANAQNPFGPTTSGPLVVRATNPFDDASKSEEQQLAAYYTNPVKFVSKSELRQKQDRTILDLQHNLSGSFDKPQTALELQLRDMPIAARRLHLEELRQKSFQEKLDRTDTDLVDMQTKDREVATQIANDVAAIQNFLDDKLKHLPNDIQRIIRLHPSIMYPSATTFGFAPQVANAAAQKPKDIPAIKHMIIGQLYGFAKLANEKFMSTYIQSNLSVGSIIKTSSLENYAVLQPLTRDKFKTKTKDILLITDLDRTANDRPNLLLISTIIKNNAHLNQEFTNLYNMMAGQVIPRLLNNQLLANQIQDLKNKGLLDFPLKYVTVSISNVNTLIGLEQVMLSKTLHDAKKTTLYKILKDNLPTLNAIKKQAAAIFIGDPETNTDANPEYVKMRDYIYPLWKRIADQRKTKDDYEQYLDDYVTIVVNQVVFDQIFDKFKINTTNVPATPLNAVNQSHEDAILDYVTDNVPHLFEKRTPETLKHQYAAFLDRLYRIYETNIELNELIVELFREVRAQILEFIDLYYAEFIQKIELQDWYDTEELVLDTYNVFIRGSMQKFTDEYMIKLFRPFRYGIDTISKLNNELTGYITSFRTDVMDEWVNIQKNYDLNTFLPSIINDVVAPLLAQEHINLDYDVHEILKYIFSTVHTAILQEQPEDQPLQITT